MAWAVAHREWSQANPERLAMYRTNYRTKHRDAYLVQHRVDEKKRRERHPERVKMLKQAEALRRRYKLTKVEWAKAWDTQRGLCAICTRALRPGRSTHTDHDHVTGRFRGLLCGACNMGLGQFQDSPGVLSAALAYLEA